MARSTFLPILLLAISKSYCVCRFRQSCALVPKYRDNRSAISAVIAPSPSHYFIDRWRSHTEFLRHLVRAQFQRPHEIVEQDIPGMYGP